MAKKKAKPKKQRKARGGQTSVNVDRTTLPPEINITNSDGETRTITPGN